MRLPYDIIIIDLELNQPSSKIIEIGAVRFLRNGEIHPVLFSSLVSISEELGVCTDSSKTITELTGITSAMVQTAPALNDVLDLFEQWLSSGSKNFVLASWGGGDIPILRREYATINRSYSFRGKALDIKSMVVWSNCLFGKKWKSDGLGSMLHCWDMVFEGQQHRAGSDAMMTAKLLQTIWHHFRRVGVLLLSDLKQIGISNDSQGLLRTCDSKND